MDILALRLDAPLMSFGGVMVDNNGPTDRFPGPSLLAGLLGNALGYAHGDSHALESLQARIELAARWDVTPQLLIDYHTVDLDEPKMREPGWTTRGKPEHRGGGKAAALGTHERYRHYLANGVMTLAVSLAESEGPDVHDVAHALREPARPLFVGRKTCLPAAPICLGIVDAPDVLAALRSLQPARRLDESSPLMMEACWPERLGSSPQSTHVTTYSRRDWRNQLHTGSTARYEGLIEVTK